MLKLNYVLIGIVSVFLNAISCDKVSLDNTEPDKLNLNGVEGQLVERNNLFTLNLFKEALSDGRADGNVLLSPLSVTMAIAMTNNGGMGVTKDSINEALNTRGISDDELNAYYHKLLEKLPGLDSETTLSISNSLWVKRGFDLSPAFSKTNKEYFQATIEDLDFSDASSKDRINKWVDTQTAGKIPAIVDDIPADMVLYLINAIYFKSTWQEAFDKERTRKMDFIKSDGSSVQTDFMNMVKPFNIIEGDGLTGIKLPYHDGKFSLIALMPEEGKSIFSAIDFLYDSNQGNAFSGSDERKVNLFFPKFKFSYENTLNDELSDLGMGIAFTDKADFTGINPDGNLLISAVKHKSFIEVNEEGTEAAAATSVGVSVTSMPILQEIKFDKPFVFLIREESTGLILFVGLVSDPTADVGDGG